MNLKENEMDEASLMMIKVCVDSDHDKSCTFKTHKEATFESFKVHVRYTSSCSLLLRSVS